MALAMIGLVLFLQSGAESAPCASGTTAADVTSTGDVQNLAVALACDGEGAFNITWFSSMNITDRIDVANTKTVTITGEGFPSIHGVATGRRTGLFSVSNGSTLRLNGLALEGGDAESGGAVDVHSSSSLFVFGCTFADNNATNGGETLCVRHKLITKLSLNSYLYIFSQAPRSRSTSIWDVPIEC